LSFEPLPREFFARDAKPPRLMLPRAKLDGLYSLGCDSVGLLRFNAKLASMPAEDFVREVLVDRLSAREVWVGPSSASARDAPAISTCCRRWATPTASPRTRSNQCIAATASVSPARASARR
jgi:hypothetical protein